MALDRIEEALAKTTGYLNGLEQAEAVLDAQEKAQEREPVGDPGVLATQPVDLFGDSLLISSPPCPYGLLPTILEHWANDAAERIGVDPAMIFMPMLAVCAAAVDDRAQIRPLLHDTSWKESARVWVAFVAESGEKKSPALTIAVSPLDRLDLEWVEEDRLRLFDYHAELNVLEEARKIQQKAAAKALASGRELVTPDLPNPPTKPTLRRKIVRNATIESLSGIMSQATGGLLEVHDELSGWFGSFDVYRSKVSGKDRSLYLEAYNGGPQIIDRVSSGRTYVPNWSLSLVGGIQPEPMKLLAGQMTSDGLIQRFMVVFTKSDENGTIDRPANDTAKVAYENLIRQLATWDIGGPEAVRICQLSAAAQPYRELINLRVRQVRYMPWVSPAFRAHLSKWEGLFPRLTLLWHLIEHADNLLHLPDEVGEDTAGRVAAFMLDYLLPHAARFYTETLQQSAQDSHVQWVAGHILTHEPTVISVRDIGRAYRTLRGNVKEIQGTMEHLTELSWVAPEGEPRPGGPTRWKVNPAVHTKFAFRAKEEKIRRVEIIRKIQESIRDFPQLQAGSDKTSQMSLEGN